MTETRQSTETQDPEPLLDSIRSPKDLKGLPEESLPALCEEIRTFLLESVQRTGGHLGSNIGVVELAVALHYVFDFQHDRLVWDVSHQCYPHKILTGRRDGFAQLRKTGGLCGFTNPHESEFDLFHTGHAGTSISLGLGLATGAEVEDDVDPRKVVSVIGDASLGAGVAFEALNNAGATGRKMLVILNDNEWSISKSVGSLARYLSRIRSNRLMQRAGQETKNLIHAIPVIGPKVDKTLDDLGEVMRHAVVPGHVFEELGVRYVGPIDGHDVSLLVKQLRRIAELDGTVVLHTLTEKGKGHPDGPDHPERVHAVKGAAEPKAGADAYKTEPATGSGSGSGAAREPERKPVVYTNLFANALSGLAEKDLRVHALTAAMPSGTGLDGFATRFPARFHDTGITEQHAVAMAAGMAKAGLRPVVAIYSTFLQRAYDQVFQEVALQNLPVLFALDRAGPVGQDGPTHNGVFDIAYLRTLPNFTLCSPRDATDMRRMLALGLRLDGPLAVRYPRGNCPTNELLHESERREMEPGKAEVLRVGDERLVLWAFGSMVQTALEVSDRLRARGVEIGVVDARFAKPLDEDLLAEHSASYRHIVTLEDHQRAGGFGSAVLEVCSRLPLHADRRSARVRTLGIPDRFVDHKTSREEQLAEVGLDPGGVERALRHLLQPSLAR
ncbi:MAG: 1-deoxy-D-xylulose-5-phosphate synthase [bacterium]|nr:1-deoxy-D-xylulose-5-phosphate synthase [bacterium]